MPPSADRVGHPVGLCAIFSGERDWWPSRQPISHFEISQNGICSVPLKTRYQRFLKGEVMATKNEGSAVASKRKSNAGKLALIFGVLFFSALPFMARQSGQGQSSSEPELLPETQLDSTVRSYFSASIPRGWSVQSVQTKGVLTIATLNVPSSFASSQMAKPVSTQQLMVRAMCPSSVEPSYSQLHAVRGKLLINLTAPPYADFSSTECRD